MKLSISHNFDQVAKQLDALQRDVQKAAARALNKTAVEAQAAMAREMQKTLGIPAAKIAKVLHIDRARVKGGRLSLRAILEVRSRTGMALQPGHAAPQPRSPVLNRRIAQARQQANGMLTVGMMRKAMLRKRRRAGSRRLPLGTALTRDGAARVLHAARPRLPGKASLRAQVVQLFRDKRTTAKTLASMRSRFPSIFERELRKYIERFDSGSTPGRAATSGKTGSFLTQFFSRVG